ncbi:hypothetical protein EalM132_00068 [Exiguobacterium phage vB_EalM-132]|nr:hypothetical protein EalM132_00068 [Exiguobacterium phage vB_EalM-132]
MPYNVINVNLANKEKVLISNEFVDFNSEGLGTIQSEDLYHAVLELKGFFPEVKEEGEQDDEKGEDDKQVDSKEDEQPSGEGEELGKQEDAEKPNFEAMTHAELDAYAKDHLSEDNEYPASGNKKEKADFLAGVEVAE